MTRSEERSNLEPCQDRELFGQERKEFRMLKKLLTAIITVSILLETTAFAVEVKKIQDNSFLIEEAYNQEPGVVHHIQIFQYRR